MDKVTAPLPIRLTELAHGGGCGCKLAPAVLQQLLAGQASALFPQLLVGTETSDDAAVWQLPDGTCVIATTDFFMPVVDDPHDFGRIAATNAISDVYAMGGTPILALAILGMPLGKLPVEVARDILAGGAAACAGAGIPVAGGHSIDTMEPIYGLAVIGTAPPERIRRNAGARPGDALILTKAIGVGIYANALRKGVLDAAGYAEMLASTTLLNRIGAELGKDADVHAVTDVTGFGLLGHGLEMARASNARLRITASAVPLLQRAYALAEDDFVTGASHRNWDSYGEGVTLPASMSLTLRHLLTDAQTSGGLLVSCAAEAAPSLLDCIRSAGYPAAAIIGTVTEGPGQIEVLAG
ncbi:MAG TPA: selenide, water dikinase SelD [Acetobacteraceae bacterium]|jgi:selenide,water dikinase|nr:selenide, water dikinase SelD [Acetobacteraceae bacterium]